MKYLYLLIFVSTSVIAAVLTADVTFTWQAPSQRADNTPISLSELSGYNIYCGANAGQYDTITPIIDGQTFEHTIHGMEEGKHYCVITSLDTDLQESEYSNIIVVNITQAKAHPKPPYVPVGTTLNIVIPRN